jgi:hypothetical protein
MIEIYTNPKNNLHGSNIGPRISECQNVDKITENAELISHSSTQMLRRCPSLLSGFSQVELG